MIWLTEAFAGNTSGTANAQLLETGKNIYRKGLLSSGQALEGLAIDDITLKGAQAACINCHLRSGLGTSEAGQQVLPITGMALYQPGPPSFWYQHQIDKPDANRFRPAYSDITLATAIRSGLTSTNRTLQRSMPRFNLSDADLKALFVYLKSLSNPSPAVDDKTIHWATVVTPDTDPAERKALLDLMETFFKERNTETNRYRNNGHIPPNRGYAPLLDWELHVWELQGAPETWSSQLETFFHTQPVFALLSGIGPGDWQPIHHFCESFEVACLFPNTFLPTIHEGDFYSLYFSKGLTLEAEVLAEFLSTDNSHQTGHIVQVYRKEPQGEVPAAAFRKAIKSSNKSIDLNDRAIDPDTKMDSNFWQKLIKTEHPDSIILWLSEKDLAGLKLSEPLPREVFLSGHLLKGRLPDSLCVAKDRIFMVSPLTTEKVQDERFSRVQNWLETSGLAVTDKHLQGNVLWLLWLLDDAVEQITHYFSPAYLIERIEYMINLTSSTLYPHISMKPGQRFAAKGGYILRVKEDGVLEPLGSYIVPNASK